MKFVRLMLLSAFFSTVGCYATFAENAPLVISCQGRLFDGKQLMQGEVDLQLRIYEAPTDGDVLYEDRTEVQVVDGIYATYLGDDTVKGDLAAALSGGGAYLEVVANGVVFAPREKLGAEAYALVASRVIDGAITAEMMGPDSVGPQQIADGSITSPKLAEPYWSRNGNKADDVERPVLGTLDEKPLLVQVNGQTALRVIPQSGTVALVGGPDGNEGDVLGAVVAGGGTAESPNVVAGEYGVVAGGVGNQAAGAAATVSGGQENAAKGDGGSVGGGYGNEASGLVSVIGGGSGNQSSGDYSTVVGGRNSVASGVDSVAIGSNARAAGDGQVIVSAPGNVGINTPSPEATLHVAGSVKAESFEGDGSALRSISADRVAVGAITDASVADNAAIQPGKIEGGALTRLTEFSGAVTGTADALQLKPGSVTAEHLAEGVIPEIPTLEIKKGSITADKLAEGVIPAVPEFNIEKGSITADKLAKGVIPVVPDFTIEKGSITADKLAKGVIPEFKIEKGSITREHLAKGVLPEIPAFEIEKGSITADKLAKGVIPEVPVFKIENQSITPEMLSFSIDPADAYTTKDGSVVLGTEKNRPVSLQVDGQTAFHLAKSKEGAVNVTVGAPGNAVKKGSVGATISGGGSDKQRHQASGKYVTIGGGLGNTVDGEYATVGGGFNNRATGSGATVGGGWRNQASGVDATVAGGQANIATGFSSTITGGFNNEASGKHATVGGGVDNLAKGDFSVVAGRRAKAKHTGAILLADGQDADLVSTAENQLLIRAGGNVGIDTTRPAEKLTVAGNIAPAASSTYNLGSDQLRWSRVYLGEVVDYQKLRFEHKGTTALQLGSDGSAELLGLRLLPGTESPRIVGGFSGNEVSADAVGGNVAGGGNAEGPNKVSGQYGTVSGGFGNTASGFSATISGGQDNQAIGTASMISGGYKNVSDGLFTVVSGGVENRVSQKLGVVNGGYSNQVAAAFGVISGGAFNEVNGEYGMAAGRRAKVQHSGSFVWADAVDADVETTARNQFVARASGGVQFFSNSRQSTGVLLPPGSGSWAMLSDANQKTGMQVVDGKRILNRLAGLPLYTWRYKGQDVGVSHIGPTAQDFFAAFGFGEHDTHISAIDADGIALSAIQALTKELDARTAELTAVKIENKQMQDRLDLLEQRILQVVESQNAK